MVPNLILGLKKPDEAPKKGDSTQVERNPFNKFLPLLCPGSPCLPWPSYAGQESTAYSTTTELIVSLGPSINNRLNKLIRRLGALAETLGALIKWKAIEVPVMNGPNAKVTLLYVSVSAQAV